jgi:three-Cys-motif partner protein
LPHKADRSFFDRKKPWSKRKDLILSNYLKPYLAKVSKLGRPITVVDGFAGAGRYVDGEPGSPVIIGGLIEEANARGGVPIRMVCTEDDDELFDRLKNAIDRFPFAEARHGTFLQQLAAVEQLGADHTLFLYVDPYAIEGLEWDLMDRVFMQVQANRSVEVLLNFSAVSFVRRALAALSLATPAGQEEIADGSAELPSIQRLNAAVGGDWWHQIVASHVDFAEKVQAVADGFCDRLRTRFSEVCQHAIRAEARDQVPKYTLVFGSRHVDALILMNDATIKSRDVLAEAEKPTVPTLFETRPTELVPDISRLPSLILDAATQRMPRKQLVVGVIRRNFCTFQESQIKKAIEELIKGGRLTSSTGKHRINDLVEVWRP